MSVGQAIPFVGVSVASSSGFVLTGETRDTESSQERILVNCFLTKFILISSDIDKACKWITQQFSRGQLQILTVVVKYSTWVKQLPDWRLSSGHNIVIVRNGNS